MNAAAAALLTPPETQEGLMSDTLQSVLQSGALFTIAAAAVVIAWSAWRASGRAGRTDIDLANARWLNARLEDALRRHAPEALQDLTSELRDSANNASAAETGRHRR